jgi:hypothetical protein
MSGSMETCDVRCEHNPITDCISDDGYCPANCQHDNDDDCIQTWAKEYFSPSGVEVTQSTITKLSSSGEMEWQHSYETDLDVNKVVTKETNDHGYILSYGVKKTESDIDLCGMALIRINSDGTIGWKNSYFREKIFNVSAIEETIDGYVIAGFANGDQEAPGYCVIPYDGVCYANDYFVMKIGNRGEVLWQKMFHKLGPILPGSTNLAVTKDGNVILIMPYDFSFNSSNPEDVIIGIDSLGNLNWTKVLSCDSTFLIHGKSQLYTLKENSVFFMRDVIYDDKEIGKYLAAIESSGDTQWQKSLVPHQTRFTINIYSDEIILSDQEDHITKLDSTGNFLWRKKLQDSVIDTILDIRPTSDGGYILHGDDIDNTRIVVKYDPNFNTSDHLKPCIGQFEEDTEYEVISDVTCEYEDTEVLVYDADFVTSDDFEVTVSQTDFTLADICTE